MPCTTILVGKKASYDGSTLMARNEDSGTGTYDPKKYIVVNPDEQPRHYKSVLSGVEIELPDNPVRYTAMPNALKDEGIWGEAGINAYNVAMSETETITSNARVLGADPLVDKGIGEEDMLTIVLPYIKTAREGVVRLGALLEQYGTYEMNGIGFQDVNEIWWLESIGGHHWIARRVPDEKFVVMPNQMGIDWLDMNDDAQYMFSADLKEFMRENHLLDAESIEDGRFNPRIAFGSKSDSDHVYNTPRAWYMLKILADEETLYELCDFQPESDEMPWCAEPKHPVTIEDIKYVLSSYYQGTEYNPYANKGDGSERGKYRVIGINRNNFVKITQLRPYAPAPIMGVEWIAEGSNAFNGMVPFYANVTKTPEYLSETTKRVTTENFYWASRIIGALADAHFGSCIAHIERYQMKLMATGHAIIRKIDKAFAETKPEDVHAFLEKVNQEVADMAKEETYDVLDKVLHTASNEMKNAFSRADG